MQTNNSTLIKISLLILGVLAILGSYFLITRGTPVLVDAPAGVNEVRFVHQGNKQTTSVTPGESKRLTPGDYVYTLVGENIQPVSDSYVVGQRSDTLTIDYAPFSRDYLDRLLDNETRSKLLSTVRDDFIKNTSTQYRVGSLSLYDRGDTAGVVLVPDSGYDVDNPSGAYRAIYIRSGTGWRSLGDPEIIRTTTNSPGINIAILKQINQQY